VPVRREPPLGFLEERFPPLANALLEKPPAITGEAKELVKIEAHDSKLIVES
jgi:hypothetical protein